MKSASGALASHLTGVATTMASCWKVARRDGVILGFTSHDQDIPFDLADGDGVLTYKAASGFNRSNIENTTDFAADNLDVEGVLSSDAITAADLRAGRYDFAEVRIFDVNYKDLSQGALKLRRSYIGEVRREGTAFVGELRGLLQLFEQELVELYSPACRADLFDSRCKLDPAAFTASVTVDTVMDRRKFTVVYGGSDDFFTGGLAGFASGANSGLKREIKNWDLTQSEVTPFLPLPFDITVGDALSLRAGCDKTLTTCRDQFANVLNFRGEPYVPGNDLFFRTPNAQ